MFKSILFSLALLHFVSANAYIPKLRTILSNTAEKRISGSYKIENELVFQFKNDKLVVRETWYIQDDNNIFISARGPNFAYTALHKEGKRYRPDGTGQILSSKEDSHFYSPLFTSADPNYLAKYIGDLNLVPKDFLAAKERIYKIEDINYRQESHIRLTRLEGLVAYGIGEPSPKDALQLKPQIWIEQDLFLLRKIRGPNFSVEAQDFKEFQRGFWFPQRMKLHWAEVDVDINTVKLTKISLDKKKSELFQFEHLKKESNKPQIGTQEAFKSVEAFYQLFR